MLWPPNSWLDAQHGGRLRHLSFQRLNLRYAAGVKVYIPGGTLILLYDSDACSRIKHDSVIPKLSLPLRTLSASESSVLVSILIWGGILPANWGLYPAATSLTVQFSPLLVLCWFLRPGWVDCGQSWFLHAASTDCELGWLKGVVRWLACQQVWTGWNLVSLFRDFACSFVLWLSKHNLSWKLINFFFSTDTHLIMRTRTLRNEERILIVKMGRGEWNVRILWIYLICQYPLYLQSSRKWKTTGCLKTKN